MVGDNKSSERAILTKHECEELLLKKFEEMIRIYHQYNPNGKYLSLAFTVIEDTEVYAINNAYYKGGRDEDFQINASKLIS